MDRRHFLGTGIGAGASLALGGLARPTAARGAAAKDATKWRTFEVTTRVEIASPSGVTRAWVPLPLTVDTDYQRSLGQSAAGNAKVTRVYRDAKYDAAIFYAEWPAGEKAPVAEVTTRHATRDRAVDPKAPGNVVPEDPRVLAKYVESTKLIRTDGIVRSTALEITQGATTDLDRGRAIYDWIVDNTFRDPKVRGCGVGDIGWMLETRNLGGKCADLNALFVGLARAVGLPARDIYGVRVADSAEFKSLGKSGEITKAQHCRAEFYLPTHGWFPVDPADVRKVVLEEKGGLSLGNPIVRRARVKLFGAWEMNYLCYNYAHDVKLPNSAGDPVAFFMYPQAETAEGRLDSLDADSFRYKIVARELTA